MPINSSIAFEFLGEVGFRLAFFIFDISRRRPEKSNSPGRRYLDQRPNVPAIFLSASEPNLFALRELATLRLARWLSAKSDRPFRDIRRKHFQRSSNDHSEAPDRFNRIRGLTLLVNT